MEKKISDEKATDKTNGKHSKDHFNLHPGHDIKVLYRYIRRFLNKTLNIREGTDIPGTVEGIKKDIAFRGHKAWILMFSIFIASIGLNVNSIPVIIGAMLISPLMGPILGIGLSVGTNDWETLVRSLRHFAIAIGISLLTSAVYFLITPLKEAQTELLARTKPTFLDVWIAVFGGLSGIVAGSRREKSNVVPGVAIATALMPPLCTAGYGLATLQMKYFLGALYLFFLNSVFISLSTIIVVRILHFPTMNFIDPKREVRLKRYMAIFLIIVILPSAKIFLDVIQESRFNMQVQKFIAENLTDNPQFKGSEIINQKIHYSDTLSVIDLYVIGDEISQTTIQDLNKRLNNYGLNKMGSFWKTGFVASTDHTEIRIHQASSEDYTEIESKLSDFGQKLRIGVLEDIYKKNERIIHDKDSIIRLLENELAKQRFVDTIPFSQIEKELIVQYPEITKIAYAKTVESELTNSKDTIPTFLIDWTSTTYRYTRNKNKKQIEKWLKVRLNLDTVRVIGYN